MMSMSVPLNALFVIAEMAPLVKVGGLGDVGGALPRALRRSGADVRVALPLYASLSRDKASGLRRVAGLGDGAAVWEANVRDVRTYLIEHRASFGREQVYGYDDDTERFLAFCDTLLGAAGMLDWQPDVLNLHDWHTGFLATRLVGRPEHRWSKLPRVFTVHNLGIPGGFDEAFAQAHDLPEEALVPPRGVEPEAVHSGLGQGILHCDLVSTVSPSYAREILTPEFGGDLTALLFHRRDQLAGIMNGIDTKQFDPATDPHLAARFDAARLDLRIENKRALQARLGLPMGEETPLIGMVGRLYLQKGPDLAVAAVERLLGKREVQFVALGQGDEEQERALTELAARHPAGVAVRLDFDEALGQLIYGGCDLFLMPSRYEPCGLGQLIAMRYGAVPVVRRTGGLADSVEAYGPARGTGFLFDEPAPDALYQALEQALAVYHDRAAWGDLQQRCLAQDFSWDTSAHRYLELYERAGGAASARPSASEAAR